MTFKAPKGAVLATVWQNSAAHFGAQTLLFSLSWGVAPGFHRADPLGLNRKKKSPVMNRKTGARTLNWRTEIPYANLSGNSDIAICRTAQAEPAIQGNHVVVG